MSWAAGLSRGINTYMGMKQDERDEQARLRMMDEEDKRWERRAQKSAQIEQKYREVADAKARAREVIFQNINPETGALEQFTAADADKGLPVPQSILSQQRAEAERAGVEADRKARLDEAEINRRQQVGQGAAARGQAAMIRAQQAGQGGEQQTRPRTEQNFVDEFNNHLRAVRQLTTGDNNVPKELREQATRLQQQLAEFAADKNATPAEKAEAARILTAQLGILPQQIR